MTNKFIELSGKIDPRVKEALLAFDQCAAAQNLSYRRLCLTSVFRCQAEMYEATDVFSFRPG